MFLCYLDESGTPDIPGNTSHYVLAGIVVPIWHWRDCDREIGVIRKKYGLVGEEIHTAWILRPYLEQRKISNFQTLSCVERRQKAEAYRNGELLRLQRAKNQKAYRQAKKNYAKTNAYIHLTFDERKSLIQELAKCISKWGFARLFAECVDKISFPALVQRLPVHHKQRSVDEQALEQVVSRFESHLRAVSSSFAHEANGLLIHDNNDTVAKKHTLLMQKFHVGGTLYTKLSHVVETPLFVNSQLTSMVQIADLCGYVLRRYLELKETELFDLIFVRADRKDDRVVGVRHFTSMGCNCKICTARKGTSEPSEKIAAENQAQPEPPKTST
jgi:hypothetical protein